MARKINNLAEVKVYINGKEQALKDLDAMQKKAAELKNEIDRLNKQEVSLGEASKTDPTKVVDYNNVRKEREKLEREYKKEMKLIRETKKFTEDIAEDLDRLAELPISRLNTIMRSLNAIRNQLDPTVDENGDFLSFLNEKINQTDETIKNKKGAIVEFKDIMDDLSNIDNTSLAKAKQRLESLLSATDKDDIDRIKQLNKEMKQLQDEQNHRVKVEAQDIMDGNYVKTIDGAKQAIELLKKYQGTLDATDTGSIDAVAKSLKKMNAELETATRERAKKVMQKPFRFSPEEINEAIKVTERVQSETKSKKQWANLAEQIAEAKRVRDSFANSAQLKVMSDQFKQIKDLSVNAFAEQKKYWSGIKDSLTESDPLYRKAVSNLKKMDEIETGRAKLQSTETLSTGLMNAGTADIKQAVDWLTKYQGTLEPLGKEWNNINALIEAGNSRLKELTDKTKYQAMSAQFNHLKTLSANALSEQKKYWTEIRDGAIKGTAVYDEAIDKLKDIDSLETSRLKKQSEETLTTRLMNAGTADIKQAVDWLTKYQGTLEPLGKEWREVNSQIEAGNNRLKVLTESFKMESMVDQFQQLDQLSVNALSGQKKYWQEVKDSYAQASSEYKTAVKNLEDIKALEDLRTETEAQSVISEALSGSFNRTNEETREAIRLIEEYKKQLATGNVDAIKDADKAITELNRKMNQAKVSAARDVLGNTGSYSAEQIKQAVDWLGKYRATLSISTQEWKDLGVEIQKANEYMERMQGADRLTVMEQKLNNIGTISASSLGELKKYWQEMVDNTDRNNTNLAKYEDNLKRVIEEEKARKAAFASAVMSNLDGSSVAQIREAIKANEELRESVERSNPKWEQYSAQIENAHNYLEKFETEAKKAAALDVASNTNIASTGEMKNAIDYLTKYRDTLSTIDPEYDSITKAINDTTESLKKFNDSVKMNAMNQQMLNLRNLSKAALAEQKKYWQGVYDSAEQTSQAYRDAEMNLLKIDRLERSRTSTDATRSIAEALSGSWDKTIKETEEAIKLIQEYKNQLRTQSDAPLIDKANEAIDELNRNLGKAKEALMDIDQAKQIASQVSRGAFNGTSEDIDKAKKSLEELRKKLKMKDDADEVEAVDKALNNLSRSAELGGKNLKDIDKILADLNHASVEDLQTAAKQLQKELSGATRGVREYAETSKKLQDVNRELERAKKEWEGQESLFIRMTKRLSVYMAAYGSLSAIISYVKDLGTSNIQLSDSIADVAKTTGLEAKELSKLGAEIRAIDTRTAQEQLYELAAAAGQLGIKSETEIAGFVRAANMITVSLNELGTEATTQLMKIATLTGESQKGTEKALLSIGSAINELTANSAAAAGPIVDLMNRMGGIASQSGITSAQMAAIGATADALGQSVEITGTSMNKFLATLMSKSDQIAYALNMDAQALRSFINEGKTMDAVISVFEKMNNMGGLEKLAPIMGELGSEGARMAQVLAAMAGKVDFLKEQLNVSTKAYDEAISIQNEYNVKNENAIAILQRMGNAVKELFVNNVVVDVITSILRSAYQFGQWMGEASVGAKILASTITALTASLIANRMAWIQNMQSMTWTRQLVVMRRALIGFRHTLIGLRDVIVSKTIAIKANIVAVLQWGKALFSASTRMSALTAAGKALKALWATNWITIIVAALAGMAAWIVKTATYVSETTKATAKYNRELQEEKNKVDTLFNSLRRINLEESKRAGIINQINQQYGQYLGFMLDEKDSADKLAAAHQLINAELRKRMALNLQSTLQGKASNSYSEAVEKTSTGLGQALEALSGQTNMSEHGVTASEVINKINEMVVERVTQAVTVSEKIIDGQKKTVQSLGTIDSESFLKSVQEQLSKEFNYTKEINGQMHEVDAGLLIYNRSVQYIRDLLNARISYQKEVLNAENIADIEMRSINNDVIKKQRNMIEVIKSNFDEAEKNSAELEAAAKKAESDAAKFSKEDNSQAAKDARAAASQKENELKDHYQKMIDNANDYVEAQRKLLREGYASIDRMEEGERKTQLENERQRINEQIALYQKKAAEISKKIPGMDPWGKGRDVKDWKEFADIVTNIDTSSATALAAAYKKITEDTAKIPDNVQDFYEMFRLDGVEPISLEKLGLDNADSVAQKVHDWAEQIKNKLKTKYGRNTTLGFIFEDDSNQQKTKARQNYQSALSALEAFYKEEEDFIRQQRTNELITEEAMNRRLLDNTAKYHTDRQQLIKKFLGEESTFDKTRYVGILTGHDYFGKKDLDEMAKQYQQWGDAMTDGGRNQIAKSGAEIAKAFNKEQEKIKAELLKGDVFATFENSFATMLDELGVLTSDLEDWADQTLDAFYRSIGKTEMFGLSPDERQQRISELVKFADQSYQVNAEGLRTLMIQDSTFANWAKNLTDDQMNIILQKLRGYYDDRLSLTKRHQEQMKKEFEAYYEQTGKQNSYERQKQAIDASKGNQSGLEGVGVRPDYAKTRENIAKQAQLDLDKKEDELEAYADKWAAANDKLFKATESGNYEQIRVAQSEMQAAWDAMAQAEVERNELLAQSQRDLTQVYMDEWTKRAERWGQWGEMFGEYLGEQIMLEKQANDARARGDLETAKKIEQQQKQNKQALIQNLLSKIVDEAALWAKEYALKMMFNSLMLAEDRKKAIEEATLQGKSSMLSIFLNALTGQSKEQAKGLPGLITGAVIFAATMALQALAKSAISNMFPEAATGSTGTRKLSTGMLTYKDGNYPVLGNDGKVYDAKYEGAGMKTGIYGGGAHFGIFSEKQPEMIVDGKTTQKLILNYPYIYDAITTIAKNGRLVNAMPTFASGDYPSGMKPIAPITTVEASASNNEQMERMSAALEQTQAVNSQLLKLLQGGIVAHLDGLETHKTQKRNERFLQRRGVS